MDYPTGPPDTYVRRLPNQSYDYRQAVHANGIITDEFVESLGLKPRNLYQKFSKGRQSQQEFTRRVFMHGMKLVLETCMATNKVFVSPTLPNYQIYIRPKNPGEVQSIIKKPIVYKNVDLFETDFRIYEFVLHCGKALPERTTRIRIGYTMYKELVDRANKGQSYSEVGTAALGTFSMSMIARELEVLYPTIDSIMINRILRQGFYRIMRCVMEYKEIKLKCIQICFQFILYHNLKATR